MGWVPFPSTPAPPFSHPPHSTNPSHPLNPLTPTPSTRASKARFDAEEDFKTRAREAVTRLQSGDESSLAAWCRICEASRREFNAIYGRLGVTLQERGESFYNPMLKVRGLGGWGAGGWGVRKVRVGGANAMGDGFGRWVGSSMGCCVAAWPFDAAGTTVVCGVVGPQGPDGLIVLAWLWRCGWALSEADRGSGWFFLLGGQADECAWVGLSALLTPQPFTHSIPTLFLVFSLA